MNREVLYRSPFVMLKSKTNRAKFRLDVERRAANDEGSTFSTYGLSSKVSVPVF
jgi:CRISPR-associated endoribonuclease Cas6/Csy4 subtype I-F